MSTQSSRHDGVERMVTALYFFSGAIRMPRAPLGGEGRSDGATSESSPSKAEAWIRTLDAGQGMGSRIFRFLSAWGQRRAERLRERDFVVLMDGDPRVRREFQVLRDRSEWADRA